LIIKCRSIFQCNISKIHQVYAPQMYGMYMLHKEEMILDVDQKVQEKLLYHVTTESRAMESLTSGLDWRRTQRNKFGCGVSFSYDADYANYFANNSSSEGINNTNNIVFITHACLLTKCYECYKYVMWSLQSSQDFELKRVKPINV